MISPDIYKWPWETLQRIIDVVRERGMQGLPCRIDLDCRRHFPGQGKDAWQQGQGALAGGRDRHTGR